MPSRRSHSKSRNGCVQCKRSRIKCDQSWPSCSKCAKSNKTCQYTPVPSGPSIASPKSLLTPSLTSSSFTHPVLPTPSSPFPAFEPADLELMHHYSTSTYLTIATNDPKMQQAWQVQAPIAAYSHSYLMHGLLALAALHRISLLGGGESRHLHASTLRHYNDALATSKPALCNVDADNCTSLFLFSAVIATLTLALPLHFLSHQFDDPVAELSQIATLVRGSKTIVLPGLARLKAASLGDLIPRDWLAHECDLPSDTRTALDLLRRHVDGYTNGDPTAKETYKDTIQLLESSFRNTVSDPENRMVVMSWLANVPDAYISLLHARAPIAQVCLAYYAVLLHGLRRLWWCGDWGKRLIGCIEQEGDAEWQNLLEWPRKKII